MRSQQNKAAKAQQAAAPNATVSRLEVHCGAAFPAQLSARRWRMSRLPGRFLRRTLPCAAANEYGAATSDAFDSRTLEEYRNVVAKRVALLTRKAPQQAGRVSSGNKEEA